MSDDRVERAKEQSRRLLDVEEKYRQESDRIKQRQEKSENDLAAKNYNIQLSKAKTSVQAEKLKQERIFSLQKDADEKYLSELKAELDREKAERDKQFRDLKYNLDAGVISEQEYYSRLAQLRDIYFEEGSEQWQKYSVQIAEYNKTVAENIKKAITEILSDTSDKISEARQKVSANLEKYTSLFDTVNAKYKKAGPFGSDFVITKTYLADLDKQTEVLKEYHDAILAVRERGDIPEELFAELRDLDVEDGLRFAKTLLGASNEDFDKYIEAFKAQQDTIKTISKDLTQTETDKAIAEMKSKLSEVYGDIPEEFWSCGADSAVSFGDAFVNELEGVFAKIKNMIAQNTAEITPMLGGASGAVTNSYSASYNFYGSGESVASQLQSARAAAVVERMRGGYGI